MPRTIPSPNHRKWQVLVAVLILVGLYFVFSPARDPQEVIRENLHTWAAQLEKGGDAEADTKGRSPAQVSSGTSAALIEGFGDVRRLTRAAFTEQAQVRAVRGPQEQGREAIAKWCFALRSHAETLAITLDDIDIRLDPATPDRAEASLTAHIRAQYAGGLYVRTYHCEMELLREKDKKWRITTLDAQIAPSAT